MTKKLLVLFGALIMCLISPCRMEDTIADVPIHHPHHKDWQKLEQEMDARLYEVLKLPHFARTRERLAAKLHLNLTEETNNDADKAEPPKFIFGKEYVVERQKKPHTKSPGIGMDVVNLPMMYQGDLLLNNEQADFAFKIKSRKKRQAVKTGADFPLNRWNPKMAIAFTFDSSLSKRTKDTIRAAIQFWEDHSCVKFEEDGLLKPMVRFFKGPGCFSEIGKNLYAIDQQQVSIGPSCSFFGPVAHEVGHVLGLIHTHSRYDRDSYVELIAENLPADMAEGFDKETRNDSANLGVPYDYGSLMHYSGYNHVTGKILMAAKDPRYQHTMGNSYGPVFSDLLVLNKFYTCENNCLQVESTNCTNQGFPNPKNCTECICPNGFGASDCSERASGEGGAPENCGQTVVASKENQTLRGVVTANARGQLRQAGCHFHIQAPKGKRVELTVNELSGKCSVECVYGAVEVKFEDLAKTGARICCQSHMAELDTVVSAGELAIVSVYSYKGSRSFSLTYRLVDANDSMDGESKPEVENDEPVLELDKLDGSDCKDLSANCDYNKGACVLEKYRENMERLCRKTCGLCGGTSTSTEPTTTEEPTTLPAWLEPWIQNRTTSTTTAEPLTTTKSANCEKEDHDRCDIWSKNGICMFQFAKESVQRKLCPHICGMCD